MRKESAVEENKKQNITNEEANETALRKDSKFWKETSKIIMKGKNDRNVQTGVYFDDLRGKKRKEKRNKHQNHNEDTEKLKKAWSELQKRYQQWYDSSKYSKKLR